MRGGGSLLIVLAVLGCGDGDPSLGGAGGGTPCGEWGAVLCARACSCAGTAGCVWETGPSGSRGTTSVDSADACERLVKSICIVDGSSKDVYYASCAPALQNARCVPAQGDQPGYVEMPAACEQPSGPATPSP
jgi:hypothetical protein